MVEQRLERFAEATADANGNATFTFEQVEAAGRWQGSVQVIDAPSLARFIARVATTTWGSWSGGLPFGPIQVDERLALVVEGSALSPGVRYLAAFVGAA